MQHEHTSQRVALAASRGRLAQRFELFTSIAELVACAIARAKGDVERVGAQHELELQGVELVQGQADRAEYVRRRPYSGTLAAPRTTGVGDLLQLAGCDGAGGAVGGKPHARVRWLFDEPQISRVAAAKRPQRFLIA